MATDNGPSRDVSPTSNSFPKKSIGKDWGGEDDAMNAPNTPSMETAKHRASINLITDYCEYSTENETLTSSAGDTSGSSKKKEPVFGGDEY